MTDRQTRAVAEAITKAKGDEWGDVPRDKQHWTDERGMFGLRFRDVNEPFQCDYLGMAQAAIAASDAKLIPALVEALKRIAEMDSADASIWPASDEAREVLKSLPEEYKQ